MNKYDVQNCWDDLSDDQEDGEKLRPYACGRGWRRDNKAPTLLEGGEATVGLPTCHAVHRTIVKTQALRIAIPSLLNAFSGTQDWLSAYGRLLLRTAHQALETLPLHWMR